jgi:TonB family protein
MRAAFCLTIILLSATIAHADKSQPSGTPAHVTFTPADARRVSAYTPRPQYPSIGRRIRASGVFRLYVSLQTGSVTSTQIEQSTGYQILDATAIDTLKRWRFKPDVFRAYFDRRSRSDTVVVRVPITFGARSALTNR